MWHGKSLQANAYFGTAGMKLEKLGLSPKDLAKLALTRLKAISDADIKSVKVILVTGRDGGVADEEAVIRQDKVCSSGLIKDLKSSGVALTTPSGNPLALKGTRTMRSTNTNLDIISKPVQHARSTRIICTMGPACWSKEGMRALLDAGCDIIRLNFSHGDHAGESPLCHA
jgi:hypothetical protein